MTADATIDSITYAQPTIPAPGIELLETEPRWKRYGYGIIALIISIGFFYTVMSYWVPAHPGTDQNGYLVGGKMFAQTLTMRQSPTVAGGQNEFDPHQFVGRMWVGADLGTPDERYYPKYPLGLPVLYACLIWISSLLSPAWRIWLTYGLSPVAMSFAVLGSYLLARRFAGSFGGLLTAIVFATSPVAMELAINPNSHASAVCCVVWGMYFLIGWWQFRGAMRAIAAGFLLGYAATIRYSEATLILPIGLVALFSVRWRDWKTLGQSFGLFAAWAIPVALLVLYNHYAIGDLTGYGPTNESSGFQLGYAVDNWETMLRGINTYGIAQMFPFALAGLVWMFWWNWRAASVITAWIVPCLLTYTFYYWAPDGTSIGYLRFFTTILPGLAMCFFWLVTRLSSWAALHDRRKTPAWITMPITLVAGLMIMLAAAYVLDHAWRMEHDPADIGVNPGKVLKMLRLSTADASEDTDTLHDAALQFQANRFAALAAGAAGALIAFAVARGRVAVPAVGAGLFAGIVVAIHLTNAVPSLEQDQLNRYQVAFKVDAIRESIPDGSVIICPTEDNLLNVIQFAGDYALYDGNTFRRDFVQNLPNSDPPDQPQGLDPGRRDALYKRLKDFTQPQLDDQVRRIMHMALAANRRVFFVIPTRPNQPLLKRVQKVVGKVRPKNLGMPDLIVRLCTPDRFATEVESVWPGYVPSLIVTKVSKPRGIKADRPPDLQAARQAIELIEVTLAVPGNTRG